MTGMKIPEPEAHAKYLHEQLENHEREKLVLLDLSNQIARVKDKRDFVEALSSRLKRLFYFTHLAIAEVDKTGKFYQTFLVDPSSRAKDMPQYNDAINAPNSVADEVYAAASKSNGPYLLDLCAFDSATAPSWLKVNVAAGIKEAVIKILPSDGMPRHSIILFSDKAHTFNSKTIEIIEHIASHLATAVDNIIVHEEIQAKDREKTFLLEFSQSVASSRTRSDLSSAIHGALKKLSEVRAYFVRTINSDGSTMSPFMHDEDVFYLHSHEFKNLLSTKIPIGTGITAKVLTEKDPVLIDFEEEVRKGNTDHYIEFWKTLGDKKPAFQKMFGTALRMGKTDLGVLWVITPKINSTLLNGICAQISVALSNIQANEELKEREDEKSILLSISEEIASLRSRSDLSHVLNTKIKQLFAISEFGIAQINDDRMTYSSFVLALGDEIRNQPDFESITSRKYKVTDRVFQLIMQASDPIILDVAKLANEPGIPDYVDFWRKAQVNQVIASALRVGGKNIGCAFLHTEGDSHKAPNMHLLKAVCAQVSVAVSNILANEQVLQYKRMLEIENDHLKEQIRHIYNFSDIIGSSPEMQKVFHMMSLVAGSNSTVLLLGETGTGKELIARAIHNASPRKGKLMIKVNCAALPANLIESELFGHEKGAFTGAVDRRIGKFELANNGTLFLDEIGEMPLEMQVKLLRAIQEREIERVGGRMPIRVDVRIIAATNRRLEEEIEAGRFRSDLYYRLNVFPITLPPLRMRPDDIEPLANFFLDRYNKNTGRRVTSISAKVLEDFKSYAWPGNVRELEHLIERSILLNEGNVLRSVELPGKWKGDVKESHPSLMQTERAFIIETLKKCRGKISGAGGAAAVLEIPATTLHSKLKKLKISKADYASGLS